MIIIAYVILGLMFVGAVIFIFNPPVSKYVEANAPKDLVSYEESRKTIIDKLLRLESPKRDLGELKDAGTTQFGNFDIYESGFVLRMFRVNLTPEAWSKASTKSEVFIPLKKLKKVIKLKELDKKTNKPMYIIKIADIEFIAIGHINWLISKIKK